MSKRVLYVIPNYECNLKCSHCDIKDLKCEYNEEALIKAITENTYDEVILFVISEPELIRSAIALPFSPNKNFISLAVSENPLIVEAIEDCVVSLVKLSVTVSNPSR